MGCPGNVLDAISYKTRPLRKGVWSLAFSRVHEELNFKPFIFFKNGEFSWLLCRPFCKNSNFTTFLAWVCHGRRGTSRTQTACNPCLNLGKEMFAFFFLFPFYFLLRLQYIQVVKLTSALLLLHGAPIWRQLTLLSYYFNSTRQGPLTSCVAWFVLTAWR